MERRRLDARAGNINREVRVNGTLGKLASVVLLGGALAWGGTALRPADAAAQDDAQQLTFSSSQSQSSQTAQSATGGRGRIDFAGSLQTSTPCYTLSAAQTVSGSDVTVTVTATPTGGICAQVITYNNYTGRVSGLSAGTYNFTVVHVVGSTSTTAYSSTVTVR